jgi:hypothetical protein
MRRAIHPNYRVKWLFLFFAFCLGSISGYAICWFEDVTTPYIDRQTAIRYGLENARAHCAETGHSRPVDCSDFQLVDEREDAVGWFFTFRSSDGHRTHTMIIRRKGEYDGTGESDLDASLH